MTGYFVCETLTDIVLFDSIMINNMCVYGPTLGKKSLGP